MLKYFVKILLAAFLMAFLTSSGFAELSAEVDSAGKYKGTVYIEKETGKGVKIWTKFGNKRDHIALNEDGDLYGDLKPFFKENIYLQNYPYVIWPKFDGNDYDIAFSKWMQDRWAPIIYLEEKDNPFDDLDPVIDFDANGRSYAAWWRDENDIGVIYISLFLESRWMVAYPISNEGVDSRNPQIRVVDEGVLEVNYVTPERLKTKTVIIHLPDTITDDIDPFGADMIDIFSEDDGDYLEQ